jgi:hypothetical protein
MRTTPPDQDPMTAMVQVMLSGKCTEEQFRTARRAVVMAEYGRTTDAELAAASATSPGWLKKLSDAELDALIDCELDGGDAEDRLRIVAGNKTLSDADRAEIRDYQ